jgi:O-acetyl-ADP-ribose deacetylase (regulator of RNase III)
MIIYRKGDVVEALLDGEVNVLIHQTNCQGVMGSGIAKQIKEKIPKAYDAYKTLQKENQGNLILGDISHCWVEQRNKKSGYIININGQDQYTNRNICNTNYAALGKGLIEACSLTEKKDIVAMPKIGAGLGGGDWNVIEAIINSVFNDRDVFVYTLD